MKAVRVAAALRWVMLPFTLLHELAHVLVAAPWADSWQVSFGRDSQPSVFVEWREDAPGWGIALAHLAPMVSGAVIALATGVTLAFNGFSTAQPTGSSLLMWVAFGLGLIVLTWPSRADIRGARNALDGGGEQ